jgi:hypothetical protein
MVYLKFSPGAKGQVLELADRRLNQNGAVSLDEDGKPVADTVIVEAALGVVPKSSPDTASPNAHREVGDR